MEGAEVVKAPMPGTILSVNVKEGIGYLRTNSSHIRSYEDGK